MPRATKVLFVIPGLRQGGAERQLLALMHRLPPRFTSTLCVYDGEQIHYRDQLPAGEPRHILGRRRMNWRGLRRLADIVAEEQPDVVHTYRDRANLWTRVALTMTPYRPPVVITSVRNRNVDPLNLLTEASFLETTDRILANSQGIKRELVEWVRLPADRIDVIPNFIDLSHFRPPSANERAAARAQWQLDDGDFACLLPGRVSLQKHQVGFLFALWQLKREGKLLGHVKVLLAGRERDRLYAKVVHRLVGWFGLSDHVRFLGPVTDMASLYHASDAVTLPSLYEGMPNAVIEAQACGLPALVSDAANADGLVVNGDTGLVVPTADADALAAALGKLLAVDADSRKAMGERGRARISQILDDRAIVNTIVSLYDRLLAAKGLGPGLAPVA